MRELKRKLRVRSIIDSKDPVLKLASGIIAIHVGAVATYLIIAFLTP